MFSLVTEAFHTPKDAFALRTSILMKAPDEDFLKATNSWEQKVRAQSFLDALGSPKEQGHLLYPPRTLGHFCRVIQSKWQINGLATINYPCGPYLKQTRGANQGNCQHHNEDLITLKCSKSLWLFFLPAEQRAGVSLRKGAATSAEVIIKLKRKMDAKKDARRAKSYPEASREIPQAVPKARPQFCCWNHLRGVLLEGSNQNMKFFSQSLSSVLSTPILLLFD